MNKHILNDEIYSKILIEELSPYGNLVAYVESNDETCYFYLVPVSNKSYNINFKPSALWLRNLVPAPEHLNISREKPPLMPEKNCKHKNGHSEYNPEELKIIWFSDGCGAILLNQNKIEAIIPPWSSLDNIAGYSKESIGFDTPFLPLPELSSPFYLRIQEEMDFWANLKENPNFQWLNYKNKLLNQYKNIFGEPLEIYEVPMDFLPKVEIAEFNNENYYTYITIGLSRQPLPKVEFFYKSPEEIESNRFIEMLLILPERINQKLLNVLGMFATFPWRTLNFIGFYHSFEYIYDNKYDGFFTIPLKQLFQLFPISSFSKIEQSLPKIKFMGLLPATQEDFLIARGKGIEFAVKKKLTKLNI
ncbi:MAG: hypothetical protein KatS3mg129_3034 [Leptospiraceae bacterium]|nr:MAG: hypothetical protein KatS3mg129_3034 [Leptospiraceae bacterium]